MHDEQWEAMPPSVQVPHLAEPVSCERYLTRSKYNAVVAMLAFMRLLGQLYHTRALDTRQN